MISVTIRCLKRNKPKMQEKTYLLSYVLDDSINVQKFSCIKAKQLSQFRLLTFLRKRYI